MSGITSVLNIARGALIAHQTGMDVTSHNIANVNTLGYTRQRLILDANSVMTENRLKLGLGVKGDEVIQYFDQFTTKSINQRLSSLSEFDSKRSILDYLQSVFNETDENGLNQMLEDFWNSWQDLADNPGGIPERNALLQKANNLCQRFHTLYNELAATKDEMNFNLNASIKELNSLTKQIASLNERIIATEASGTTANDLRDQRNNLTENISQLVSIRYLEDKNGAIRVMTTSGIALVEGNQFWDFSQEGNEIYWNNAPTDISDWLSEGKIGAWLDMRDSILPQYMANLDELAGSLIYQLNNLHFDGYAMDGSTGKNFFASNPGDDYVNDVPAASFTGAASYIALSTDVEGNPANLAASSAPGESGNNENALAIQALQDSRVDIRKWVYENRGADKFSGDQNGTLDEYYTILVSDLGMLTDEVNRDQNFQQTIIDSLNGIRDSISGVNLDEEMIDLIKYQHAFTAASKLVSAADQMLSDLMDMR